MQPIASRKPAHLLRVRITPACSSRPRLKFPSRRDSAVRLVTESAGPEDRRRGLPGGCCPATNFRVGKPLLPPIIAPPPGAGKLPAAGGPPPFAGRLTLRHGPAPQPPPAAGARKRSPPKRARLARAARAASAVFAGPAEPGPGRALQASAAHGRRRRRALSNAGVRGGRRVPCRPDPAKSGPPVRTGLFPAAARVAPPRKSDRLRGGGR